MNTRQYRMKQRNRPKSWVGSLLFLLALELILAFAIQTNINYQIDAIDAGASCTVNVDICLGG